MIFMHVVPVCAQSLTGLISILSLLFHSHASLHGRQHIDTPDNTVETKFDFNEENYKRVEMVSYGVD